MWLRTTTVPAQPTAVIDEPLGARYSLGMTLWHLGHNAALIGRFHEYVKAQGMTPENLLRPRPDAAGDEDTDSRGARTAGHGRLNGWQIDKEAITSGAGDSGPTVSIPVRVPQAGCYRLWVQYDANLDARGVTFLKIYRTGQEQLGPICQPDEIYDTPAASQAGDAWKDLVVDLPAGDLTVKLGHVTRWWHGPGGYDVRRIDCLYLTDELWSDPPAAEARKTIRDTGTPMASSGRRVPR